MTTDQDKQQDDNHNPEPKKKIWIDKTQEYFHGKWRKATPLKYSHHPVGWVICRIKKLLGSKRGCGWC